MADLGAVAVRIGANISGLQRGLSDASGRLSAFVKDGEGAAARIKNSFSSVSGVVTAAIAGASIGSAFRSFIQNTIDAQDEQAQLAAVLQSTGNAAGYSQQKLNEMAEAMAKASTFDSGEINIAQTRLLSYTGVVGESFPRAMQNAIDMATRMGMSVSQAAETVGRALDIPSQGLTALTKQGFRFTDAQKDLVKQLEETGKTAEAQAIIMEAMESSYKGAAAAAQNTLGGAIKNLQNAIKDTLTGDDQSVNGLTEAINDLANEMNSPEMKAGFGAIMSGLANIASYAVSAFSKLTTFGKVLGEVIAGKIHGSDSPSGRLREEADALEKEAARLNSNKLVPLLGRAFGSGDKKALEALKKASALRQQAFEYDRDFKERLPEAESTNFKPDLPVAVTLPGGGGAGSDKKKSAKEPRDRAEEELKRQQESAQRELEAVQRFLATKRGLEAEDAAMRIAALDKAREMGLIGEQLYQESILGVKQKHAESVSAFEDEDFKTAQEKLDKKRELELLGDEEYFKQQMELAAAHYEQKTEMENVRYQTELENLQLRRDEELISLEEYNAMVEAATLGHEETMTTIAAEAAAARLALKDEDFKTAQEKLDKKRELELLGDEEYFKQQMELAAAHYEQKTEMENVRYQTELENLQLRRDEELISLEEYNALLEAAALGHEETMTTIAAEAAAARLALKKKAAESEVSTFKALQDTMAALGAAGSRAAFNLHKAMAISSALISAKESVVNAYNYGVKTGSPLKGLAMAAMAAATTASQIAAIRSQSFGGGGSVSAGGGGGGGGASGGSDSVQAPTAEAAPAAKQTVTISLQGEVFGAKQVRELIEKINDATKNGAILNMV